MATPVESVSLSRRTLLRLRQNFGNLSSLFVVQIANAAVPLIAFPYLLRVAGQDLYAEVALSEAAALVVLTVALYSFDIDALAQVVGLNPKHDATQISVTFSGVLFARLLLFTGAAVAILLGCYVVAPHLVLTLSWWLLLPLSQVLQSAWLFNGLERNGPLAVTVFMSRLAAIVLILLLVRGPEQYLLVPIIISTLALGSALSLLIYAFVSFRLRICRVPLVEVWALLSNGRSIFFGNLSVLMYRDMNVVLLGAAGAGAAPVAAYSLAEKFVKGIQAGVRPLSQFFFPKAVRALRGRTHAETRALKSLLSLSLPQLAMLLVLVSLMGVTWIMGGHHIPIIGSLPGRNAIGLLLLVMVPAVFFGVVNFMLGSIGLNYLTEQRYLFLCLLTVGALNLAVCYGLASWLGGVGAAMAFVFSEVLLTILILRKYWGHTPSKCIG